MLTILASWHMLKLFDESNLKRTIDSAFRGPTPFRIALGEWGKRYSLLLARCYVTHYMGSSLLK